MPANPTNNEKINQISEDVAVIKNSLNNSEFPKLCHKHDGEITQLIQLNKTIHDKFSELIMNIDGKFARFEQMLNDNEASNDACKTNIEERISKLEKWQSWVIGVGSVLVILVPIALKHFFGV